MTDSVIDGTNKGKYSIEMKGWMSTLKQLILFSYDKSNIHRDRLIFLKDPKPR